MKHTSQIAKMDEVILVDENDKEIGTQEKMEAHRQGNLHRAFSILIFNKKGETLLQKRAKHKYHCGGLWTNTCCSHPRPGESLEQATQRRLEQEFGFTAKLEEKFSFQYRAEFDNGLTENEIDHVFVGFFEGQPKTNPEEISDYKWISLTQLKKDIEKSPDKYTPWFKIILSKL